MQDSYSYVFRVIVTAIEQAGNGNLSAMDIIMIFATISAGRDADELALGVQQVGTEERGKSTATSQQARYRHGGPYNIRA